jgi:hypothetical protein
MEVYIQVNPDARTDTTGIEPLVLEAMEKLGTFEADGFEWLLAGMCHVFDMGHMGREMRKIGDPLTADQREIINFVDKYEPLTIEACTVLNDIGIVNPIEAFDNFCRFVTFAFYKKRKLEAFARLSEHRPWIRYSAHDKCCKTGRAFHGTVVQYSEMVALPLTGCTNAVCCCDMQSLSDRDRIRYNF